MPTPLLRRKRGRPPRHPADVLRTRLWFHVVKLRTGLGSAHAIELSLEADRFFQMSGDGIKRTSKWDGYAEGSRVPKRLPRKKYAVDIAEASHAGTAAYFYSPIWSILKGEVNDVRRVDELLRSLEPTVLSVIVKNDVPGQESKQTFLHIDENAVAKLVAIGSFDALAATLLLVLKSEFIGYPPLREIALDCYFQLQPRVTALPEIHPFAKELFLMIDLRCKHWVFPTSQSRLEVVIFSETLHDRRWRQKSSGPRDVGEN